MILGGGWVVVAGLACESWIISGATATAPRDGQVWDPQLPLLLQSAEVEVVVTPATYDEITLWGPGWSRVDFELAGADRTLVICVPGGLSPGAAYRLEVGSSRQGVQEDPEGIYATEGMDFEAAAVSEYSEIEGMEDCLDRVAEAWALAESLDADTGDTAW